MLERVFAFFSGGGTKRVTSGRSAVYGPAARGEHIQSLLASARYGEARTAAMECLDCKPSDAKLLEELAVMFHRGGTSSGLPELFEVAIVLLNASLAVSRPDAVPPARALSLLWAALIAVRRYDEALEVLHQAIRQVPQDMEAVAALANCHNALGDMREAWVQYGRLLDMAHARWPLLSARIAALDYLEDISPTENFRQRIGLMRSAANADRTAAQFAIDPEQKRRLRIGFVSPDMRQHVVATALFESVLRAHDSQECEWTIYDATQGRDAKSTELRGLVQNWREIDQLDPGRAAALIRSEQIDILVDLAGHSSNNSLAVFARKPAPIQVSWLGYPGSTGLAQMDWLISDSHSSPVEQEAFVSERIWRLPATRLCYTAPAGCPEPRLPPEMGPVTFGCFNNLAKLNPTVFLVWRRILDAVPDSRLLLKAGALDHQSACSRLEAMLERAGIERRRVSYWGWSDVVDTLEQYGDVHVALDPFPFCGGLTSLDALWMGVPVVTLEQPLLAGRQTLAMLHNIDEPGLIARTPDDYVHIAVTLANNAGRVASCRATLRDKMRASALTDYAALARNLDDAFRGMWQQRCEGATRP
jgi:predicted O-linked N-acetylglucosamine transferase (SPINDLY family)